MCIYPLNKALKWREHGQFRCQEMNVILWLLNLASTTVFNKAFVTKLLVVHVVTSSSYYGLPWSSG